ncbi:MAG: hypothetical protein IPJ88_10365 [Myxococcales bacterium]|nr:MAG: hypothetical protein IPJ88_10365 [Myxococcales bacterium]
MDEQQNHVKIAKLCFVGALSVGALNVLVWWMAVNSSGSGGPWLVLFSVLALLQLILGVVTIVQMVRAKKVVRRKALFIAGGVLTLLLASSGWLTGIFLAALGAGGGWGRPLRVRGRQIHPELREGSEWAMGPRPSADGLDAATRRALEALWLHDAQKEHASVPAFARISWLLAAVGAPPRLHRWAQQCALEEIEHTERCFALAAGYAARSHTVEPMPDLLLEGIGKIDDPVHCLVYESITDGCQLEGFNADVAARCAEVCQEPVTRQVLIQIAKDEACHAEFSLALLNWALEKHPTRAQAAMEQASKDLEKYPRPTASSFKVRHLVNAANPRELRHHGRLADSEWAEIWQQRLNKTTDLLSASSPACRLTA